MWLGVGRVGGGGAPQHLQCILCALGLLQHRAKVIERRRERGICLERFFEEGLGFLHLAALLQKDAEVHKRPGPLLSRLARAANRLTVWRTASSGWCCAW